MSRDTLEKAFVASSLMITWERPNFCNLQEAQARVAMAYSRLRFLPQQSRGKHKARPRDECEHEP
eukprot:5690439-Pyramimonas_sp.AAC.1